MSKILDGLKIGDDTFKTINDSLTGTTGVL